jgi:Fe2+ transport system protein FeoA
MASSTFALEDPTAASVTAVPLLNLVPGTVAILRHVADAHSRDVLRSLGLGEGARLTVWRLGDPCIIQVRSTRIGLSKIVAQSIYVAVEGRDVP